MRELQKVEKSIKVYEKMLQTNPENAKEYRDKYLADIEILQAVIEVYINDTSEKFQKWCDKSVEAFESIKTNIGLVIFGAINIKIINYHLNKFSYGLSKAGIIQRKLEIIKTRFVQYQYFCN